MMKSQCQKKPDAELKVDQQHYHPLDRRKHLSCHDKIPMISVYYISEHILKKPQTKTKCRRSTKLLASH